MVEAVKDPRKVKAGKAGSARRWGPPRILRLDQLDPVTAGIVRAIVEARKNATDAAADSGGQG